MMRRLSTAFKKKDESNGMPKENGVKVNGKRQSKVINMNYEPPAAEDHSAARGEVVETFEKYAQLIHASRRPLPTQTGDGTYLDPKEHHGSLFQDIRTLGFKDFGTLAAFMKNKASGDVVDDKTMLMERVIQVREAK